jgi:hypothetical protein
MQVGDYIIHQRFSGSSRHYHIGLIVETYPDAYFKVDPKAYYDAVSKEYSYQPLTNIGIYLTKTKSTKVYHPTLEELFIFKQIEENHNGIYTLQVQ